MERIKGAVAVFIGAISFGILSTFVKKAYAQGFTLSEVTSTQVGLGAIVLWSIYFFMYLRNRKRLQAYPQKSSRWKLLVSGLSTGAVSILYYKCVELLPASLAIVMLMQYIWISILIELLLFRSMPTPRQIIGVLTIIGATVLATGALQNDLSTINWEGVVYGLCAATAYALFLIVNGRVGNDYPPVLKSAFMLSGALILIIMVLTPVSLFQAEIFMGILPYSLLLSIFGAVLPPLLFAYGIPRTGIPLSTIISAAELPVAVGFSYFVLFEPVTPLQWAGVALILLVIIWINKLQKSTILLK